MGRVKAVQTPRPSQGALGPFLRNVRLVARREYRVRVRSRAFVLSTILLAAVAVGAGLVPILVRALDRGAVVRLAVHADDAALQGLAVRSLDTVLNGRTQLDPTARQAWSIEPAPDVPAARARVVRGGLAGLLLVGRDAAGTPSFEYVTNAPPGGRQVILMRLATLAVAVNDRVGTVGGLVGDFRVTAADPAAPVPQPEADAASRTILATILVILVFITSVTYGMWVATSVAEEKGSRVMEVMLNAATAGELLGGKVVGVGAAGLTQYLAIVAPAVGMLILQAPLARLLLGDGGADDGPLVGLTGGILVAFGAFFLLGFALSALLYAAAGSLVSRQEDVQQVALPMLLLSFGGYIGAAIAAGSPDAAWVAPLSLVPFFSPYLMLVRLMVGHVSAGEVVLAIALLVAAIAAALWLAIRVYRAGVLLYGQRPTLGTLVEAARGRR
jgi:ABC-2 type transport system permease protein